MSHKGGGGQKSAKKCDMLLEQPLSLEKQIDSIKKSRNARNAIYRNIFCDTKSV